MRFQGKWINKWGALAATKFIHSWMDTLDYRVAYHDPAVDPVHSDYSGRKIYLFWHEYILLPLYLRGRCDVAMLLSLHRDADVLSRIALHQGFGVVRGSTTRGGVSAIREIMNKGQRLNLAITPDGPQGPRRKLAAGAIYLSSRLQYPLVLMGFGCDRPWRVNSWDRFAVPRPHSRARAVISPALTIPAQIGRDQIEYFRRRTENELCRLTMLAEDWAESGARISGELPLHKNVVRARKRSLKNKNLEPAHRRTIVRWSNEAA